MDFSKERMNKILKIAGPMSYFVIIMIFSGCSQPISQKSSGPFMVGEWVPDWDGQFRGRIHPSPPRPPSKTRCRGRVLYYPGDRPSNTVGSVPVNQILLKSCKTEG
ncbi:MAG: hypothetical protein CMK53_06795 [Proteobacteria bacterium]|nr:hypothetical protein [Pseudomonadota bacterium]MAE00328.1 hypothetical protein [Pseudomonadota bacterium]